VVAVGIGWWLSRPKVYEAKWVYVWAQSPVTVENGEVVLLPPDPPGLGSYRDMRDLWPAEHGYFQKHGWQGKTVIERFQSGTNVVFNATQVSNAFESIRVRVGGNGKMPVVETSVESESKELALAVMKCWADNVAAWVEYENAIRMDKALLQLRSQRERLRKQGCDTSGKDREIAAGVAVCKKQERHIYTVKPPYVEQ